jgi:hypothetical protein
LSLFGQFLDRNMLLTSRRGIFEKPGKQANSSCQAQFLAPESFFLKSGKSEEELQDPVGSSFKV